MFTCGVWESAKVCALNVLASQLDGALALCKLYKLCITKDDLSSPLAPL